MEQLIAHLIGDYFLQSDWQALNKRRSFGVAMFHGFLYALPFLWLNPSPMGWWFIWMSHTYIDHYGLARYVCWAHNWIGTLERPKPWADCVETGFSHDRPVLITFWLMVIVDNSLHLICNHIALT